MSELSVRELPLFPLPEVVLFPQEYLPLHIFETRYRVMLESVLKSDSRFGVVRWDPIAKKMADVGCCAEIIKHQTSQDGRSNIVTIGQQRFRILEIISETPFINALVSWVDDEKISDQTKLLELKDLVAIALKDVVSLTSKLTESEKELPDSVPDIPRELSFWKGTALPATSRSSSASRRASPRRRPARGSSRPSPAASRTGSPRTAARRRTSPTRTRASL